MKSIRNSLYIACRYLMYHRIRTVILVVALAVIIFVPLLLDMVVPESQVLCGRQRYAGGDETLDGGVVGQIEEEDGPLQTTAGLKTAAKDGRFLVRDTNGGEDDGKLPTTTPHLGLGGNLGRQLAAGQTKAGEDGQFLAAHKSV